MLGRHTAPTSPRRGFRVLAPRPRPCLCGERAVWEAVMVEVAEGAGTGAARAMILPRSLLGPACWVLSLPTGTSLMPKSPVCAVGLAISGHGVHL